MSPRLRSSKRPRRWRRIAGSIALGIALVTRATSARADDQQKAEELFDEARKLMKRKSTLDKGCAKLEESLKLWDRGDTVLNLALCHRMQGKTATAWAEFDRAITHGIKVRFPEAIEEAKKQRAELGERLSRLTVTVAPKTAELEGLTVEVRGEAWPRERWNTARELDPGPARVKANAKGHKPFEVEVVIGPEKDAKTVTVLLEPIPAAPPPPPPTPPPVVAAEPRPLWPWILGGAGIALGAGAIISEVISVSGHRELDEQCGAARNRCPRGYDFGPARTRELLGFGLFVGLGATGLAALGVASVELIRGSRSRGPAAGPKAATQSLSPSIRLVLSPTMIGVHSTF